MSQTAWLKTSGIYCLTVLEAEIKVLAWLVPFGGTERVQWTALYTPPPNSYIEALIPNVTTCIYRVFRRKLRLKEVIRVEPQSRRTDGFIRRGREREILDFPASRTVRKNSVV